MPTPWGTMAAWGSSVARKPPKQRMSWHVRALSMPISKRIAIAVKDVEGDSVSVEVTLDQARNSRPQQTLTSCRLVVERRSTYPLKA
jgi:hypothetical protein